MPGRGTKAAAVWSKAQYGTLRLSNISSICALTASLDALLALWINRRYVKLTGCRTAALRDDIGGLGVLQAISES